MQTSASEDGMSQRTALVFLTLVAIGGIALRLPALHWLQGAGISADYSFHPDVNRFVLGAEDIHVPNPDGYPAGMTTQLYLLTRLASRFAAVGIVQLLQSITLFYSAALTALTFVTARFWGSRPSQALFAAALLTVAPVAVVQSNFGTADMAAASLFYATLLAGGAYLKTQRQLWFVLFLMNGYCGEILHSAARAVAVGLGGPAQR
jgi:hypothetical protein